MFPTLTVEGAKATFELLSEIADRARDATPAWDEVADDVFDFEAKWWADTYGGKKDRDQRAGRNPEFMRETGGLKSAATSRGSARQTVKAEPTFLLVEVTDGLAEIHERRGRAVLGEPGQGEADRMAEHVAQYILTGERRRG
ncbi:MAG: hypothetical protein PGN13_16105 [Patulibacter minatonensis]